jgi:hypothetical protein
LVSQNITAIRFGNIELEIFIQYFFLDELLERYNKMQWNDYVENVKQFIQDKYFAFQQLVANIILPVVITTYPSVFE